MKKSTAPMVIEVVHTGSLLALIIKANFSYDGITFFTPPIFSQQLGYMKRDKGYVIPAHIHLSVERKVHYTHEVLIIRSGKARIDIYTESEVFHESHIVETGDVVLLANGGHGITMLEETQILEVKQGPYAGDNDKKRFEPTERLNGNE
jgi:hypothetical protein